MSLKHRESLWWVDPYLWGKDDPGAAEASSMVPTPGGSRARMVEVRAINALRDDAEYDRDALVDLVAKLDVRLALDDRDSTGHQRVEQIAVRLGMQSYQVWDALREGSERLERALVV